MGESNQDSLPLSDDQLAQLEQKAASDPSGYKCIGELAAAYADRGRWQEAIDAYQDAIALEPDKDYLYSDLAIAYEEAGEAENAEKNYLKALSIKPNNATTQFNLGILYKQQGRTNEAIRYLKRCLTSSDDPRILSDARREFTSLLGTGDSREWVQVTETFGVSQTEMIIEYLRDNGIHVVAIESRALGLITGTNTGARVMVPEDEVGLTLSLLKPEDNNDIEEDDADETYPTSQISGIDKAVLVATAFALSPLGTVIAYSISRTISDEEDEIDDHLVDCPNCGIGLELSDDNILDGRFACPECDKVTKLDDLVVCSRCRTQLELDADELSRGWYICPECRWAVRISQS